MASYAVLRPKIPPCCGKVIQVYLLLISEIDYMHFHVVVVIVLLIDGETSPLAGGGMDVSSGTLGAPVGNLAAAAASDCALFSSSTMVAKRGLAALLALLSISAVLWWATESKLFSALHMYLTVFLDSSNS